VRSACGMAVLTRKPCRIFNLRQGRREPGLRSQHLLAVRALAELCGGTLQGDQIGSGDLRLYPGGGIRVHDLEININTAASVTLIAQALIPAAIGAPHSVTVHFQGGATDTPLSPPLDYFEHVFLWFLKRCKINLELQTKRRGYYPEGGADLSLRITPATPKPTIAETRGLPRLIRIFSQASESLTARKVAERQIEGAMEVLGSFSIPVQSSAQYHPSSSPGSSICIVAEFEHTVIGADAIGALGKRAETVGREAGMLFLEDFQTPACLDRYMADQLLPYIALARRGHVTVSKLTNHSTTNMWVIEKFVDGHFTIDGNMISWSAGTPSSRRNIDG
jgi:RNA 3'-terminal phosphate cyclase (GTP)